MEEKNKFWKKGKFNFSSNEKKHKDRNWNSNNSNQEMFDRENDREQKTVTVEISGPFHCHKRTQIGSRSLDFERCFLMSVFFSVINFSPAGSPGASSWSCTWFAGGHPKFHWNLCSPPNHVSSLQIFSLKNDLRFKEEAWGY